MTRSKYDAVPLVDQLNMLGDLQKPEPELCAAIERRVMDMIRSGQFQEIADACALHQTVHGLTSLDSKVQVMGSLYDVENIEKWPDKFTWQFTSINPIRKLFELGEQAALKPLSKFFTGFTPSGMVVGSNPRTYGKEMERIDAGSSLHGIAGEGENALFFTLKAKKSFNDVMKLYGRDDTWLHNKPFIALLHSDKAPLENIAIWNGGLRFMKAPDYILESLKFARQIAKPLYAGEPLEKVVDNYLQSEAPGCAKNLSFWFGNLQKDSSQVAALQRSVLELFSEPLDVNPGLFMNAAYVNLHLALSQISEAIIPGSKQKTLHGLIMGQLGLGINFNGAYGMYCDLVDKMIDRKSLIDGLDASKVKTLHAKLNWEECLPKLSVRQLGKVFTQELGV